MAEVGNLPLPRKLLEQDVRNMLRISDARMSGTAFGIGVLHIAPEADGALAMVFLTGASSGSVERESH